MSMDCTDRDPDREAINREGFEAMVATHQPRLVARLGLIVRDPAEAADIAQETLLRAWSSWATIRPDEVGGWLMATGSRLALNELRRRRRRPWVRLLDHDLPASSTVDPQLWEALGRLRAEERVALVMSVLGGYTHAEIGERLGVPAGTVGSWISRAKAGLRDVLGAQEVRLVTEP